MSFNADLTLGSTITISLDLAVASSIDVAPDVVTDLRVLSNITASPFASDLSVASTIRSAGKPGARWRRRRRQGPTIIP